MVKSKHLWQGAESDSLSLWCVAAALLVYDVTDSETFERVKRWVKELQKMAPPGIHLTIAANKMDLGKNKLIDLGEAKR